MGGWGGMYGMRWNGARWDGMGWDGVDGWPDGCMLSSGNNKKGQISIHARSCSFRSIHIISSTVTFINLHPSPFIFIHFHSCSFSVIHLHSSSLIFTHLHSTSFAIMHHRSSSFIFTHPHHSSFVFTQHEVWVVMGARAATEKRPFMNEERQSKRPASVRMWK